MTAGSEGSPVFDFTSLDFDGIENDLIRFARARFTDEIWTDLNASNEGRRLIELMSYATDLLSYTENAHVLETIISSLIREQNFRNVARTFDFAPNGAEPSKTTLLFTIDNAFLPLVIPHTFRVADKGSGEVLFQPDADGTATLTTYSVSATQGDSVTLEALGTSDGTAEQRYLLAQSPLIDGTLQMTVGGNSYDLIVNFIEAGQTDQVYRIETDENGRTTVLFGDGINGKIPPLGQAVEATYRFGGGSQGNLPVNTVQRLVDSLPGILSVTNTAAAEGGGPKQSLTSAKRQLPLLIKANERAVTVQDYASLAVSLVPGVLKASGTYGQFQAGGAPVILLVVPNGGGDVPPALANLVVTTLRFGTSALDPGRSMAGRRITVKTPVYVQLLMVADAFVQKGSSALAVGTRVSAAFNIRYALEQVEFGEAASLQDAYNTVDPVEQHIDGLTRVFIRKFTLIPNYARYITLPTTGNGTVDGITVTEDVKRREWSIQFIAPSGGTPRFSVYERRRGTITAMTDSTIEDDSAPYVASELVGGYVLHVREQEQSEVFTIAANTPTSITVTGSSSPGGVSGLFVLASPGDSYAAEKVQALTGRVARALVTTPAASGQPAVIVSSILGFAATNKVLVRDTLGNEATLTVLTAVGSTITFTTNLPFSLIASDTLDWAWYSEDGTVSFAVVQGTSLFSTSDKLYVDTYPLMGDLQLRAENFLLLDPANLTVNTIGGVK